MRQPQPDLFNHVKPPYRGEPPAQSHSQTSIAAAASIKKSIGPLHKRILAYLKSNPSTDEEIMDALDMGGNTERPRRRELELMGRIIDSGKTRLTRSRRLAVVWRLA
jgi:hypothetical protein